jgi:hypothetical protein
MTVRYWNDRKNGAPKYKKRHLKNNLLGTLIAFYIFARYDHCDIDTIGEMA